MQLSAVWLNIVFVLKALRKSGVPEPSVFLGTDLSLYCVFRSVCTIDPYHWISAKAKIAVEAVSKGSLTRYLI